MGSSSHARSWLTARAVAGLLALLSTGVASAAFLRDVPQTLTQPDGTVVNLLASGDEYYNWLHDARGFVVIRDPATGYLVYAVKRDGALAASEHVVGGSDPQVLGLEPDVHPDRSLLTEARDLANANRKALAEPRLAAPKFTQLANIVVFIRFSDDEEFPQSRPASYYENEFNGTASGTSSVRAYYLEASYGTLTVESSLFPTPVNGYVVSYQDSKPRAYYTPYDSSNPQGYQDTQRKSRETSLLVAAIQAIAGQVPSTLNVDYNGDGLVDNVCFIIKGSPTAWSTLLWPHRTSLTSASAMINGKRVSDYNLQLESVTSPSVLCHELGHTLGAPDLYHYDEASQSMVAVGTWDLMDSNREPPQHMGAYMKYRYMAWIADIPKITASGTYALNPLVSPQDNCYRVDSPNSTSEFFVIEYRKKTGTFESSIPGSGLLVYRINPFYRGNADGPPDEVYIFRPGGTTAASGAIARANFSSAVSRTTIDELSDPFPFLTDGSLGGLSISGIGAAGDTIPFTVDLKQPCDLKGFEVVAPKNNASLPGFSATLEWAASTGASSYDVYLGVDKVPPLLLNTTQTSTSVEVYPGTKYYWRVVAKNGCGQLPSTSGTIAFTMQSVSIIALANGVPSADLSDSTPDNTMYYKLVLSAPATNLTFTTSGGSGDLDLYVRSGFLPTPEKYDCKSSNPGPSERCSFAQALAGTWYVALRTVTPYSGVTLRADYSSGPIPHRRVRSRP